VKSRQQNTNLYVKSRETKISFTPRRKSEITQNPNPHFMLNYLKKKNHAVDEIMWKYCTAGQATDDNVAHAQCMLDI